MKKVLSVLVLLVLIVAAVGVWKTVTEPASLYKHAGSFSACPARPSCVSSVEDPSSSGFVEPLRVSSVDELVAAITALDGRIVDQSENYVHAVFVTPKMRYHDDFEALQSDDPAKWEIRSVSRFGYRDFGVNGQRVAQIRSRLATDNGTE